MATHQEMQEKLLVLIEEQNRAVKVHGDSMLRAEREREAAELRRHVASSEASVAASQKRLDHLERLLYAPSSFTEKGG